MVWNRIRDALSGPPTLSGPSQLPPYFPVEPAGCEKHAEKLFACLANEATTKARDMEKMGYGKSYYEDVEKERVVNLKQQQEDGSTAVVAAAAKISDSADIDKSKLPSPNDNPLDECRLAIAYYKRCCDRELKKKKNWILTEPYRVQEEYRYKSKSG
mmetsp:Transcript_14063/g.19976  ORF Transcript_14063/g.19976 Transcript_14063/m.19976 type:complete len:157 (-) Transcript_14063:147-617(-)|eukprot:CAMPEP_0201694930 /NCGR_PEP_ID=MMETSP0578-20130828/7034_1 /ASSEMBLY_ACC=CAM_ASM_000663 /TAXON_ID=267565 /ORGANISM="Skeletonema grethea, Strain CCMP 1804" /LENGTH=156 /DNA_ID=CAMNT_0048180685 /DNA_START=49 /DNA_END=519 /DNA_ORIENTATION=-